MLDIILIVISALCMIAGLAGCILPFLPGPPIAYVGLIILHFTDKVQYSTTQLIVWLLIVAVLQVLDYFTPMLGSKYSGGSKWGNWGCIIGTLVGLLFLPWGIILGPFLGAVIGELLGNKEFSQALKSGVGSLLGFIFGTLLKFVVCARNRFAAITDAHGEFFRSKEFVFIRASNRIAIYSFFRFIISYVLKFSTLFYTPSQRRTAQE